MLFNSVEFVVFLSLSLVLHHAVLRRAGWGAQKVALTLVSYLFYASWSPPFALLLLGSTGVDFLVARGIEGARGSWTRRGLLCVSLAFNLGALIFFKYGGFFSASLYGLLGWSDPPLRDVVLPVGISFYTFESLSYTIDVYRGEPASRRFGDFALFLSFFPHLVAGPIVRPRDFLPQLLAAPPIKGEQVELALARIAQGLAKKVLLADTLGVYVDAIWSIPQVYGFWNVLLAAYAYAFQIYFDFSGYSDIAIGVAQLFGLRLPENFDRPYLSRSPREFWQRWHISLSTWLRDYLYVPLGGNRRGPRRTHVNLLLTMLIGGLWHGAAWTFVLWGGFHGALLVLQRPWRGRPDVIDSPRCAWLKRFGTFHLVCFGWILFRAPDLHTAGVFLGGLCRPILEPTRMAFGTALLVGLSVALHALSGPERFRQRFVALPPLLQGTGYAVAAVVGWLLSPASERFIYFQF